MTDANEPRKPEPPSEHPSTAVPEAPNRPSVVIPRESGFSSS